MALRRVVAVIVAAKLKVRVLRIQNRRGMGGFFAGMLYHNPLRFFTLKPPSPTHAHMMGVLCELPLLLHDM